MNQPDAMEGGVERAARLWHTLRWLKPVQLWGRAWFRLHRPRPDTRPAPPTRPARGAWLPCRRAPSMTGPARFRFLSVERELAAPGDWDRADWPRLWRYNLHYFDDLAAHDAADRALWHRALIERWIADNPPGRGTGWEPYPVSLRSVNWIKWALAGGAIDDGVAPRLSPVAVQSLAVQARWLRQRLEIHLLGNHLWANAKALVFAGAFFDGAEASGWREKGLALLRRELREQILPDGGHFERSPMYHAILLEDLLDLFQLGVRYPALIATAVREEWRETAIRMLHWLRVMSHPDGEIAFFNDATLGIAPNYAALSGYASSLGIRVAESGLAAIEPLIDSGYVRLGIGEAVLIADVAPLGPDYLPGHGHADSLSFELSLFGRRTLVNSGISTYDDGPERLRQRGTAAHNTVVVDGANSSDIWASFRVGSRARISDVEWGNEDDELWLRAAHDGYRRLPGRVLHRREWRLSVRTLRVADRIEGTASSVEANFHLAPGVRPAAIGVPEDSPDLYPTTWHPSFGVALPIQALRIMPAERRRCEAVFRW